MYDWKNKYDVKLKEKIQVKRDVTKEYEHELRQFKMEFEGLSPKARKEHEKWKKIELNAKYKLEENDRIMTLQREMKKLIEEKQQFDEEFNEKRQKLGIAAIEKDFTRKKKDINDEIMRNEKFVSGAQEKIKDNDKAIKKLDDEIKQLNEKKSEMGNQLLEKRRN